MIDALVVAHALHRRDVLRLLDDADDGVVALIRAADGAGILVTEVEAGIAVADLLLGIDDGRGQRPRLSRVHVEHVISKTHCRLLANARQCAKMLD